MISIKDEDMLYAILQRYRSNSGLSAYGTSSDLPKYLRVCVKETMEELKKSGYLASFDVFIGGTWNCVFTPAAFNYFDKKGMDNMLFRELTVENKKLLYEIIEVEENGQNIIEFLNEKIEKTIIEKLLEG